MIQFQALILTRDLDLDLVPLALVVVALVAVVEFEL